MARSKKSSAKIAREIAAVLPAKRDPDADITIVWYAAPNENKRAGGFMPVYEHNGKLRGSTYGKGYDKDAAEKLAELDALDEAARYIGDWKVVVKKRA